MDPTEFQNLQEALLFVFGPILAWWAVFLIAGGIAAGIGVLWLEVLRVLGRR